MGVIFFSPPKSRRMGQSLAQLRPCCHANPRQSLVLSDYLQTLDEQIQTLQQEMESLETRNSLIRAKVSPLL